jgi:Zn-dependent M28 family amino/carboxypeptidase
MAEILSGFQTERTVVFVAFSGEEQGIYGSKAFVDGGLDKQQYKIGNALLMDMISYSKKYFGVTVEGTKAYTELMDAVALNMKSYGPRTEEEKKALTVNVSDKSFGSDHVPFQNAGIPAILAIEADDTNYPNYHRSTDDFSPANVNTTQSVVIMRGLAATLCDLAVCL